MGMHWTKFHYWWCIDITWNNTRRESSHFDTNSELLSEYLPILCDLWLQFLDSIHGDGCLFESKLLVADRLVCGWCIVQHIMVLTLHIRWKIYIKFNPWIKSCQKQLKSAVALSIKAFFAALRRNFIFALHRTYLDSAGRRKIYFMWSVNAELSVGNINIEMFVGQSINLTATKRNFDWQMFSIDKQIEL